MTEISVILITWAPPEQLAYRLLMLKSTLTSLRQCTTIPYTLIVVDNGGPEQTQYLRTAAPDIHVINRVNQGPGASRNLGARVAQTPYLAFVDNDLSFYPGWLEASLDTLKRFRDLHGIAHPGRSTPMKQARNFMGALGDGYEQWAMAAGWCWVMEKETFEAVGPFRTSDVESIEDREWGNRARGQGHSFLWMPGGRVRHIGRRKGWDKHKHLIDGVWQDPKGE